MLCYHAIPKELVGKFRTQLTTFREMGFRFVSLDEGLSTLTAGTLDSPIMTLTFDDGDRTIYENALTLLNELNIRALLYVTVDYIRKGTTYRSDYVLESMNWQQLREWIDAGHDIGSHTLTHASLRLCDETRLHQECSTSKAFLEDELQIRVRHLSYPWGYYSKRVCRLIAHSGLYDSAATIYRGMMFSGVDPYKLRRDLCDPRTPIDSMIQIMKIADRWFWLKHLHNKFKGY